MADAEHWHQEPTKDKLDIFVSSRIQECKAERAAARNAIHSINHNAVLFEHVGARSVSPRTLYLSRLRDSQIMVAIYRQGYGYIDARGGMKISGLEDEFAFAQSYGIPTLLYVHSDPTDRDERLSRLIDSVGSNVVMWFYETPEQLEARIRDDVTAEITRFVVRPEVARGILADSPDDLLRRTERRQGLLVERKAVLEELERSSRDHPILFVTGRAGIGKTTLAAQFATRASGKYLRVSGLSPLDIFTVCAVALDRKNSDRSYSTLQGAVLAFSSAWAEAQEVVLVVDECDFIDELLNAVEAGGGASSAKRLILTSREPCREQASFEVPPLSDQEARYLSGAAPGTMVPANPTPLEAQGLQPVVSWLQANASTTAKEVVAYIALSPVPLEADDLLGLLGNDALTIEALYEELLTVGRLVDDSPSGFRLIHDDVEMSVVDSLSATPQRLRFYVNRFEEHFVQKGDYLSTYRVAQLLGEEAAERYAHSALRQSAMVGDIRFGREVAERLLERAIGNERRAETLQLMLMLAYPMELMGDVGRATELLQKAEALAAELDENARASVREAVLSSRARRTLAEADVQGLEEARGHYATLQRTWDHARLGLELSALYIASKSFEQAIKVLRPTRAEFDELEDDYGLDLAERNLAAALAALPGNEAEVDTLIARIEARMNQSVDPRRQRAWHNNILSRRFRTAGRLDEAEAITRETITLSSDLGEEQLTALTYVNLGNVLNDKGDVAGALDAYSKAGTIAQRCGRRDIEADSSRLRAGMLNDLPDGVADIPDRYEQARLFAQHAIGLLSGTIYHEAYARSHVELAEAALELGDVAAAASAYFTAAEEFQLVPDAEAYENAIVRAAENALDYDEGFYIEEMAAAFGVNLDPVASLGDRFIELIAPIIRHAPKDFLVRMLGRHLHTIRTKLPPLLRPVVLEAVCDAVELIARDLEGTAETWRLLYAGLLTPFLSQDSRGIDPHRRLARGITAAVEGVDVRYTAYGDCIWTVALGEAELTISVLTMDETAKTSAAVQCLAFFMKAFEGEIGAIVAGIEVSELKIQVASFEEMPEDLRQLSVEMFDLENVLADQDSAVTRTDDFSGATPLNVFLGPRFLERASAGEGVSGSMQTLFALTLVEVLHQSFHGEVDHEVLRPKIVSLVQRTLS